MAAFRRRARVVGIGTVIFLTVVGCASGDQLLNAAQSDFRERDFQGALGRYRDLGREQCVPDKSPRLCCAALIGEADALVALEEAQAALRAYEHGRAQCPDNLEVRRKHYLAQHASDPEPTGPESTASFAVEHLLGSLGDGARILWVGVFLDGELVGRDPSPVRPGKHDLEAEALVEGRGSSSSGSRTVRLHARQPLVVPAHTTSTDLRGTIRLIFGERAEASMPDNRLSFDMEVTPLRPAGSEPPAAAAKPGDGMLTAHVGRDLRVSGGDPRIPADLVRRGDGWKVPTEVCVKADGKVDSVEFLRPTPARDPRADAAILEAVRRWRYGSYKVNGALKPFCHPHDIDLAAR